MGFFSHRKDRQATVEGGAEARDSKSSGRRKLFAPFSRQGSPSPAKEQEAQARNGTAPLQHSPQQTATESNAISASAAVAGSDRGTAKEDSKMTSDSIVSQSDNSAPILTLTDDAAPSRDAASPPAHCDPGVLGPAYQKAWQSLSEDERKDLTVDDGMRQLLVRLDEADKKDQKESLLRRGIQAVSPFLGPVQVTLDFVGTFAAAEPIAATAIGIVKGVASVGIAISSAAQDLDLTLLVGGVLELLPVMDRCDQVVGESRAMGDLRGALCDVYKDLLRFYLKATRLLKKSNFILRMAMNMLKPELPDIVSSFNKHALVLSRLVEVETFASAQDIKNAQVETLIRDTLDVNRGNEIAYHNELKQRADEACQWITSVDEFKYWQLNLDNSNLLAMFGDMGCGKTMTTAYVTDYLSTRKRVVCGYYCKSDQDTTSLGNIYRSLVWQLLKRRPALKDRYCEWYKKNESLTQVSPAQSESHLQGFLFDAISSSEEWTFIVLDGLDECETRAQRHLLSLLRKLIDGHAHLKVFVSSRYHEDIVSALPKTFSRIEVPSSKERDRLIAAFLVDQISSISPDIREQVVKELSEKANGSAIWLRIAIEYLEKVRVKTPKGLQSHLDRLPSSKGLAELYWKLFDRICSGIPENEDRVRRSLEMLAVAQRPLTPSELSYAVLFDPDEEEPVGTVAELAEVVLEVDLLELIRPFVSVIASESGAESRHLRLVHQSVKEIILQAPPAEWQRVGKVKATGQNTKRYAELNGFLLRQCVKYLLLEECGTKELPLGSGFGVEYANDLDFLHMDMFDAEDEASDDDVQTEKERDEPEKYDPEELGFGGFFVYAAVYWTEHFSLTTMSPEHRPDPDDLAVLCAKRSQRLANWVEQCLRPRCTYQMDERFGEELERLDPLVVAAMFGPAESVFDLLSRATDHASVWRAVERLVMAGKIQALKGLVQDKAAGQVLCTTVFFSKVLHNWSQDETTAKSTQEWEDTFEIVIRETRDQLLIEGNSILCRAAARGCLPLVKKFFEVAEGDPELKAAIMSVSRLQRRAGTGGRPHHQSVGEAAYESQAEVLKSLCAQPGIEPHLYFVDDGGRTVFHQAARGARADIFRILIERWPEGLNQKDHNGDSPLQEVIYNNQHGSRHTMQTVKDILATGAADVTGRTDEDRSSPLCCAVKQGNVELCRVLAVDGSADISCALELDPETGKPALRPAVVKPLSTVEEREKMLKELCSLVPLSVSTEFLF
ncbi:hypothetical protein CONLIGDRAFT_633392 [Coniochaeta ligniaria NRRL 30616]|uniref:Nephrocystin 3-like N-terminal domain-containing protein n=1 Tax=Coniochaeta ligniaria NRRL 30616 TaxID=1408157 RepID=A0A1J7JJ05_9PEZI|nr:hypothetical protein CONLIGDRAFT_633392 [Coniochaeta ligniaria NRRL 30616]